MNIKEVVTAVTIGDNSSSICHFTWIGRLNMGRRVGDNASSKKIAQYAIVFI